MPLIALPDALRRVLAETPELADAVLVGGCVRDALLGRAVTDFDVEVRGLGLEPLADVLARHGATDLVGRSFGVVKLRLNDGAWVDFSVPRRDSKVSAGHRGFEVAVDPSLSPRDAASRRDFTINAMAWDPRSDEVLDFFGGRADLDARVLRHTSDAFGEDPLRVLRGVQFAARFDLIAAPETIEASRAIRGAFAELPPDRVRGEWWKWAAHAVRPSRGLDFLAAAGWLGHFPELASTVGVEQDARWHPEGDVWTHTRHVVDAMAASARWRESDETTRVVLMLAALAHDLGKAVTSQRTVVGGDVRVASPGHAEAGGPLGDALLSRMGMPAAIAERVRPLVLQHMAHLGEATPRAVRRLARRLAPETIERLAVVITSDASGRPPLPAGEPEGLHALLASAEAARVADAAPRPLLRGRHLLEVGWTPGPHLGPVLDEAFEAQLDGAFADLDGARAWLAAHHPRPR